MNVFNEQQSKVIKFFLEYMSRYSEDLMYDPKLALERY